MAKIARAGERLDMPSATQTISNGRDEGCSAVNRKPTAVLVLGPPRSGTSAVSHLLQELGVYFGAASAFVDPEIHSHNPIFFELRKLNKLNEKILAEIGIEYAEFDYFHHPAEIAQRVGQLFIPEIRALVTEELADGRLIGLKDPRFVLTLPIWVAALEGLGYSVRCILTKRSLSAVVKSNAAVNRFTESHNRRIAVLSTQFAALQLVGKQALIVDYDQLVDDPISQSQRVADWLGLTSDAVAAAAKVVTGNLRHHSTIGRSVVDKNVANYIAEQAEAFTRIQGSLNSVGIVELIDERRERLSNCSKEIEKLASQAHYLEQQLLLSNTLKAQEAERWMTQERDLVLRLARAEQEALAANTAKAEEGADHRRIFEELRIRVHLAEQEALAANTAKAMEGADHLRLIEELRNRVHLAEQEALAANTAKAMEGADHLRLIEELRNRVHLAEQEALAANTAKALEGADHLRLIEELGNRVHQAEQEALAANTAKADEGRRFTAEIVELRRNVEQATESMHLAEEIFRLERATFADLEQSMSSRVVGLERRQRWAVAAGACAALATAVYLGW